MTWNSVAVCPGMSWKEAETRRPTISRNAEETRRACVAPVAAKSKPFGSMVPGGGPPLAQRDQTSNLGGAEAFLLQVVDGDARDEELRQRDSRLNEAGHMAGAQRTLTIVALALYGDNHPKGQKGQMSTPCSLGCFLDQVGFHP
ncbi:hypothetical protein M885DRAFT_552785 [Pelagophyceae sp. CCMP2097]|nr:hypothetical protein M885DRAFT_552785 [Pelagophyceae sp. CCMP2097]